MRGYKYKEGLLIMSKKKAKNGNKSKVRKVALDVIIVCLLCIAGISAFNIYKIVNNYHEGSKTYRKIAELAGIPDIKGDEEFTGDINWDALMEQNSDTVAWIYLKGTKINYPVVQASDNDYYLRRMFNGASGIGGTLFVDARVPGDFSGFNSIIYGHHMKDSSMFGALKSYTSYDFAKENPRFELITPKQKYHLEVCAFLSVPADSPVYRIVGTSQSSREAYIKMIKDKARYTTGVDFGTKDKLVMLSTCAYEYEDARYAVIGKLIPWDK